ncbi:MAG: hypothetical protein HRF50_16465 [Phycisphaerae bacterium]
MRTRIRAVAGLGLMFGAMCGLPLTTGCLSGEEIEDILDELDDIEFKIEQEVNSIQVEDPRTIPLPDDLDQTIIIDNSVTVIDDISEDVIIAELPDITILGFENLTGLDGYYQYAVDGDIQGIFVLDGETLLLEYPCIGAIELISEDYFDTFDGAFVQGFDIFDAFYTNPEDFFCGDAFIITFGEIGVAVDVSPIDLLP